MRIVGIGKVIDQGDEQGGRAQFGPLNHDGRELRSAADLVAAILAVVRAPQSADGAWCINCFRPFTNTSLRCYVGLPSKQVGPLCEACHWIVAGHVKGA